MSDLMEGLTAVFGAPRFVSDDLVIFSAGRDPDDEEEDYEEPEEEDDEDEETEEDDDED